MSFVRVREGGVTYKEIDRTWMCDNMETRDAALGLERQRTVLCQEYDPQMTRESP